MVKTLSATDAEGWTAQDYAHLVLGAERLNQADVLSLSAALVENAEVSLTLVESLGALAEATRETVVDCRKVFQGDQLVGSEHKRCKTYSSRS